jgi:1,4-alpha-glucan branching enzyme
MPQPSDDDGVAPPSRGSDAVGPGPVSSDAALATIREPAGRVHRVLGARTLTHEGVEGTVFAVWAPHAAEVSVVGGFNDWSATAHPLTARGTSGVWETFVPGVRPGSLYKYRVVSRVDGVARLKADPCGRRMQLRPDTASVVPPPALHEWTDAEWVEHRARRQSFDRPMSIYEVHLGSWKRHPDSRPREGVPGWMSYRELAAELVPHVAALGFTHIELLPVTEHPYDASWGYQTVGYFAPTARHGSADDLRYLVDAAHAAGIGVILDWVPAHFPRDPHGLGMFDGTHLYEHADPRKGVHPDWGTLIFNYGRREVVSFLISSALYWIESFHVDGIRLDAVASMLYLDYSRGEGEWVPNQFGGKENIEATAFLRLLNETIHAEHPGVVVIAEESTSWPGVTHPVAKGGLGFDVKWNMGWMHDTLEVLRADPLARKGMFDKLTFGITYAFAERFLLAFSHDEVVHLKGSMLRKMPGSILDRFAGLRLLYGYMWTQPGKKLLFMGGELGVWHEWDVEGELDWALADEPMHAGIMRWVSDLNALYARAPELHETDGDGRGFEWIDCHDRDRSTLTYLRWSKGWASHLVVVANFTPMTWDGYRIPVPFPGTYEVVLCSDDGAYGGSDALATRAYPTMEGELFGRGQWIEMAVPPLAVAVLSLRPDPPDATEENGTTQGSDSPQPAIT